MLRHVTTWKVARREPRKIAFSTNQIVTAHGDYNLRLWDWETGKQIGKDWVGHTTKITTLSFSPTGEKVVSGDLEGTVIVWDVNTGRPIQNIKVATKYIYSAIFQSEEQIETVVFLRGSENVFLEKANFQ